MSEEDIIEELTRRNLEVDDGSVIGGPFIPDGWVRIYDPNSCYAILGEGYTLEEAYKRAQMNFNYIGCMENEFEVIKKQWRNDA